MACANGSNDPTNSRLDVLIIRISIRPADQGAVCFHEDISLNGCPGRSGADVRENQDDRHRHCPDGAGKQAVGGT
jgi:hypothetical protein